MVKLFIVGISRDMSEIELLELFTLHGQVENVTIITDKDSGESKGYGFIQMTDQHGADRAIRALNGMELDGRELSVRIAEDKRAAAQQPAPDTRRPIVMKQGSQNTAKPGFEKKKRPRRQF
jgi:RNA recognition motif-containing protein